MGVLKVKVGADWLPVSQGFDMTPAGFIGMGVQTAAQSGINTETDITGCTVTWNADPTHTYKTTVFTVLRQSAANGEQYMQITDAANAPKKGWAQTCVSGAVNAAYFSVVESGLSGVTTRKARVNVVGGTVATQSQGTQYISYLLVEDITTVVPMSAAVATPWTAPTYVNNWATMQPTGPYEQPGYRRIGDLVYMRGLITRSTAGATDETMFTLPVGFRPPENVVLNAWSEGIVSAGARAAQRIGVSSAGVVAIQQAATAGGWVSLDGLFFSTV